MTTTSSEATSTALLPARIEAAFARARDSFGQHLAAVHPRSVVAHVSDTLYGIVPTAPGDAGAQSRIADLCSGFVARVAPGIDCSVGVGPTVSQLTDLGRSRAEADRALHTVQLSGERARVVTMDDVRAQSLIIELAELLNSRGQTISRSITRLARYDAEHATELVASLGAWLDALGVVPSASAAVNVHPNTFRYRLKRISEISGLDLEDADQRFTAAVELRLLRSGLVQIEADSPRSARR